MELVVATRNAGKLHEFRDLARGLGVHLRALDEFPDLADPEETGATFAENALLKARAAADATGLWALGDDSGLCVDALDGAPGVRSARFAPGDDAARWRKLLDLLTEVPAERRAARFVCALAIASPGGQSMVVEGRCEGRIAAAPRGRHGFGYDPVFELAEDPGGRTLAELSTAEKRAVSHRGRAFEALRPHLRRLLRGR
jgi:XTP/dITP diphosphohydrolase